MAKVTWIGEDLLHNSVTAEGRTIEAAGPSFTIAFGVKFPKGEAVDVTDKSVIERAKRNIYFKVEGVVGRPAKPKADDVNGHD